MANKTRLVLPVLVDIIIRDLKLPKPVREYKFHPVRKWRIDLAWPEAKIAVEVEGGIYLYGAHVRPAQFEKDCEKYNELALLGWILLRATPHNVRTTIFEEQLKRAFDKHGVWMKFERTGEVAYIPSSLMK